MPRRIQRRKIKVATKADMEKIVSEAVEFIEANWRQFAYCDNPQCGEIVVKKIPVLREVEPSWGGGRAQLIKMLVEQLKQRGFRVLGYDFAGYRIKTKIFVCRE